MEGKGGWECRGGVAVVVFGMFGECVAWMGWGLRSGDGGEEVRGLECVEGVGAVEGVLWLEWGACVCEGVGACS